MLDSKNIWFDGLHLLSFQLYYLLLLVQELLVSFLAAYGQIPYKASYCTWILGHPFPYICFIFGNIQLLKALRTFCLPLRNINEFARISVCLCVSFLVLIGSFDFVDSLKTWISSFNLICCYVHHLVINYFHKFLFRKTLFLQNFENHKI